MYTKDFDEWNDLKKHIDVAEKNKLYNKREIWWCRVGLNIGFEHNGSGNNYQRPVLVLKGLSAHTCLIAPLTSSPNKHPQRIPIGIVGNKEASVVISQIRTIDTKRLTEKVGFLDKEIFARVRKTAKDML